MPGHSCTSKTGRRASGMTVNRRLRSARATSMAVVPPSRMTVSPSARRAGRSCPYRRLGVAELEGPDAYGVSSALRKTLAAPPCTRRRPPLRSSDSRSRRTVISEQSNASANSPTSTGLRWLSDWRIIWWRACTSIMFKLTFGVYSHTGAGRPPIGAVVFDVGGVLLDWNPRHLYRKLFANQAEMEWFLAEVCSPAWQRPTTGASRLTSRVPISSQGIQSSPS